MITFLKSLYLSERFFFTLSSIAFLFLLSYWVPSLYGIVWIGVVFFAAVVIIEMSMLYSTTGLQGDRILPEKFSNSDENEVLLQLKNAYSFTVNVAIVEELPVQFQKRDFFRKITIP
ncbi:MAG: DUF58 domain-containing protein, partial [Altibacter sp.]|nr:DUF58 domain-containing protein [Altibacter sp.]